MLQTGFGKRFDVASFSKDFWTDLQTCGGTQESQHEEALADHQREREKQKALRSFAHFLRHHVHIADGGGTKLEPWPWQVDLAARLPAIRRLVVLKGRQLGVSWLVAAYAVWTILRKRGALVLLVSQTEDDAIELLSKAQFIYDHLPEYLQHRDAIPKVRSLALKQYRSAVIALPSTRRAGRGHRADVVITDEHAFHQWAAENYSALSPTIDAGGQFLSVSTADGIGNTFADLWAQAVERLGGGPILPQVREGAWRLRRELRAASPPEDGWLPVFLPFDLRPGRDAGWWERRKEANPRPKQHFQEYPRDPEEAFVQTGRPVFDKEYLDKHKLLFEEPLDRSKWPDAFARWKPDELRIFRLPVVGHRYVAGADVAEGLEHGDYSDLRVLDADHESGLPTEVLSLHGHWEPDIFALMVKAVSDLYPGTYGIERNNHGLAVLICARNAGMRGLYSERPVLNKQGQEITPGKPGWLTTATTKPLLVDDLEEALRQFRVGIRDALLLPELTFYQTLPNGATSAPAGRWDDRVMSLGIAVQMVKHLPKDGPSGYFGTWRRGTV
jgi:hypothetical protein